VELYVFERGAASFSKLNMPSETQPQQMGNLSPELSAGLPIYSALRRLPDMSHRSKLHSFSNLRLLSTTLLAFALVNSLGINGQEIFSRQLGSDRVEAKSSGGRSRGGSFQRSSPSRSSSTTPRSTTPRATTPSRTNTHIYVDPYPYRAYPAGQSYGSSSTLDFLTFILIAGGIVAFGIFLWYFIVRRVHPATSQTEELSGVAKDLQNDTVTVTQLQVALLAQARQVQTDLTELTLNLDAETPEGRTELLRESVLALLRSPENWTHVFANSQTFKSREAAGSHFEQISIEERSKFNAETLAKVGGQTRRQTLRAGDEPAAYIVVTLLIGTENDNPLVRPMHTIEELQTTLRQISGLSPEYLSIFELLWSPQDAADSLTRDELLEEYPSLIQIA